MKVLFASLDTLRADRLSCLGNARVPTPNFDRLARESTVFSRAFATDIPTQPSHTSMFTGRFGINNGIVSHFHPPARLDPAIPWFPSIMANSGRPTGAVDHLFSMKDWFIRGYADYMVPPGRSRSPGSVINDLAFPWLRAHASDDFYFFVHYWDAHIPYVPPEPFRVRHTADSVSLDDPDIDEQLRSRPSYPLFKRNLYDFLDTKPNVAYIADLYDAEIAYLDHELGRLLEHLERLGILDETLLVVFADHGENMTEHDAWFDHAGLYDSVVHVPLMIRCPDRIPPGRVDRIVQLVDVMPTVLELLGEPPVPGMDGRSLLPIINGNAGGRESIVISECTWQAKRAVRTGRWKYIRCYDPGIYPRCEPELYDLVVDPTEQCNQASRWPALVEHLDTGLEEWLSLHLGDRPDPMLEVIAAGLPAVKRLEGVIEEDARLANGSDAETVLDLRGGGGEPVVFDPVGRTASMGVKTSTGVPGA